MPFGSLWDARTLCSLYGRFVRQHALQRIDVADRGLVGDDPLGMLVAGLPAAADAGAGEIDVLGVVLAVEPRRQQAHEMHRGAAAVAEHLAHLGIVALRVGEPIAELADDVAQAMDLLLPHDVTLAADRILGVLLPAEHLTDGAGHGADQRPQAYGDDRRIVARLC